MKIILLLLVICGINATHISILSSVDEVNPVYTTALKDMRSLYSDLYVQSTFTPKYPSQVHFPPYYLAQCTQILTKSVLSFASCTLPAYCKDVVYVPISRTWLTSSYLCYGTGTTRQVTSLVTSGKQRRKYHITDQHWYTMYDYVIKTNHGGDFLFRNLTLLSNEYGYRFVPTELIKYHIRYNPDTDSYTSPGLQSTPDGRLCPLRFSNHPFKYLTDIHPTVDSLLSSINYPMMVPINDYPNAVNSQHSNIIVVGVDSYYQWEPQLITPPTLKFKLFNPSDQMACDAYLETTSYFLLPLTSIAQIASHAIVVVLTQAISLVVSLVSNAVSILRELNQSYRLAEYFTIYTTFAIRLRSIALPLLLMFSMSAFYSFSRNGDTLLYNHKLSSTFIEPPDEIKVF